MAFQATGMQALFPVYLSRMASDAVRRDEYDTAVAINESNLNQNLEALYQKLMQLETYLSQAQT